MTGIAIPFSYSAAGKALPAGLNSRKYPARGTVYSLLAADRVHEGLHRPSLPAA
jgi:hypothetical protein